jgi:NAD(P)-dependent dehydrogenase (short-subunit alcohol dehydrogenase family)
LGLAKAGADVIVHFNRSAQAADDTVTEARRLGVRASALQADLAEPAAQEQLAKAASDLWGRVDVLVHSASPFVPGSLRSATRDDWRLVMGVVAEGFLVLARELAPAMVDRGEGAIVAVLDRGVIDPWPGYLAHGAAKSALWALARSLAVELAPWVRVNGIVPGPILPPPGMSERRAQRIANGTLLERWGGTDSLVEGLLYLLRSDYVTGEMLFIDGGERWAHRRPAGR